MKHVWVAYFASVLAVAGSHSVNPLTYGNVAARRNEKHRKLRQLLSYLEKRELLIDCVLYKRTMVLPGWHIYIFLWVAAHAQLTTML